MESSRMKNIVVLKNLPSNLVEEAIIILKANKKIKNLEYIEKSKDKVNLGENRAKQEGYLVKEAEMVISDYISKIESDKEKKNLGMQKINTKYKRMKYLNITLSLILFFNLICNIIK